MELICGMKRTDDLKIIDLYLLEVYQNRYTGYDTFRNEFLGGMLQHKEICIHVIVEEFPTERIFKKIKNGVTYIYFPKINRNKFETLESFYQLAIKRTPKMVFVSNFCPLIFNVKAIKSLFPDAKTIHVIHDFPWLSIFNGDEQEYMDYITGNSRRKLTIQDDKFVRYCTYDFLKSFESIDRVVCLCESTYKMLVDFYNISVEKICLIPNGMADYSILFQKDEYSCIRKKFGIPEDGMIVLLSGRLTYSKGADRICELMKRIYKSEKFYLIYVGQDDVNEWLLHNSRFHVISLGFLNFQEMHEIYSITDLGLFPSRFEQCSYAGIEYLMYGIPVLYIPCYGVRDMFDNKNAFPLILTDFITLEEISKKRKVGRSSYLKNYTRKDMIEKYTCLILNVFVY